MSLLFCCALQQVSPDRDRPIWKSLDEGLAWVALIAGIACGVCLND